MWHLGTGEIILITAIMVMVFSPSRMGQLGNALGRFVYSFKKASNGHDLIDVTPQKPSRQVTVDAPSKPE